MNKITAHSLDLIATQKLDLPIGARLLSVNVDHRFNKCLLWTLQDDDLNKAETVTFTMAKLGESMDKPGQYVGMFKDNSGYLHVFASRPTPEPISSNANEALAGATVAKVVSSVPTAAKPAPVEAVK